MGVNFLKRIELQGFKSFASKTFLDFPSRIVAVVGPNGSGKSNIIDALRWVLGEREAKKLRGDTLDKLIFAGSIKKSAVGLARVAVYFDNRDRQFPVDAEEVVFTRKIDRSGISQFLLNDTELRLKDLIQMLAHAKLGSRGLTMINQGESDIFVRSTPEERRKMVEEILGLREFRLKKHSCERRLAASLINMEKVQAMLDELAPHVRLLRRQRNRFEKRNEIAENLKEIENQYFSFHYHAALEHLKEKEEPNKRLKNEIATKEEEIKKIEEGLKLINQKTSENEKSKEVRNSLLEFLNKKFSLEKELGRIEAKIEILKSAPARNVSAAEVENVLRSLMKDIDNLLERDDIGEIKADLKKWSDKLRVFFKEEGGIRVGDLAGQQKEFEAELENIDNEIKTLREEEEKIAQKQDEANQEFRREVERLELKKNELRKLEQEMQTNLFEQEKSRLRMGELEREWHSIGRSGEELKTLPKNSGSIDSADYERKMIRLRAEVMAIGEIDENLVKEAKESEERYEFLKKELEDLKKAINDLKNLIRDLEEKIDFDFKNSFKLINEEFNKYFRLMFAGGRARLKLQTYEPPAVKEEEEGTDEESAIEEAPAVESEIELMEEKKELKAGIEIDLSVPRKSLKGIDMLSGGEKSLVSLAALFALISVSPPPFLVLDEIDAALDEENARRFSELVKDFSKKTQFVIITHNRSTMEAAEVLYGITMGDDGVSKVLSLKLEQ